MLKEYIKKGVWLPGERRKKQRRGFCGAITSVATRLIIDTVDKTFGKGLKKGKRRRRIKKIQKKP